MSICFPAPQITSEAIITTIIIHKLLYDLGQMCIGFNNNLCTDFSYHFQQYEVFMNFLLNGMHAIAFHENILYPLRHGNLRVVCFNALPQSRDEGEINSL